METRRRDGDETEFELERQPPQQQEAHITKSSKEDINKEIR